MNLFIRDLVFLTENKLLVEELIQRLRLASLLIDVLFLSSELL
jgi:hypothetical protein